MRAVCSWPVAVTCVGADSCVPSRPGRCARSLGSSPEASTKLEMTLAATLLMAGDGAVGEWTARAIGIVTCYQRIDEPSEYDMSPAKHALTQTGQEHAWPLPLCAMGWVPAWGQLFCEDAPSGQLRKVLCTQSLPSGASVLTKTGGCL